MQKRILLAALALAASSAFATVIYDNSNIPVLTASGTTASNGNVMMGGAVFLAGGSGPKTINSITLNPVFRTAATYFDIRVSISLWGAPDVGLTSATPAATDPVFTNLVLNGTASIGGGTFAANTFAPVSISLGAIALPSNFLGVQVKYETKLTSSSAYVSNVNVTNGIRIGSTTVLDNGSNAINPAVGSNIFTAPGGWWRSSTGQINTGVSFQSQNGRLFGTASGFLQGDQSLAMTVEGVVPEPATMTALALGAAAMLRRRKK